MSETNDSPTILWLTPDKPENISVGRQRIADHLEAAGFEVTLRGTTMTTFLESLRERGRFDAVVGTTRLGAIGGLIVSQAHEIPLVVDHVDPIRQFRETDGRWRAALVERIENLVFRLAAHVLYVYEEERERVERHAASISETDLGVEYDRFATPEVKGSQAARETLGDAVEDDVVVYIGGLEPIYSISSLLDAVAVLDGWTLVIVGTGSLEDEVRAAARSRNDVVFPGTVPHDQIPGYLTVADVGVSLADDPHTLKVLEYAASGLAVVQLEGRAESRFGEMVEYCADDPLKIAEAIERAGRRGSTEELMKYAARFDWGEIAATYRNVLVSLTEEVDRSDL